MSVIPIPGGTATLRDELVSERHYRIVEAAYASAGGLVTKTVAASRGLAAKKMGLDPDAMTPDQLVEAQKIIEDFTAEEQAQLSADMVLTQAEATAMLDIQDAGIVAFLENWSLPRPLPTLATVQDLKRDLYRTLSTATRPLLMKVVATHEDFSEQPLGENPSRNSSSYVGLEETESTPTLISNSTPES